MPKEINRLFPSGAEHTIYVASISDFIPYVWSDPNQLRMSARTQTSITKNVYVWNMYLLAKTIQSNLSTNQSSLVEWAYLDNTSIFSPLWCKDHDSDAGQPISALPTHFSVNVFNTFNSDKNIFRAGLTFHPLVNQNPVTTYTYSDTENTTLQSILYADTVSYPAELIVWQSMIVPAFPMCITNSFQNVVNFGPLFAEHIQISTEGIEGPVTISAKYAGSKAILMPTIGVDYGDSSPDGISYFKAEYPDITQRDVTLITNDGSNSDNTTTVDEYEAYRSANIRDCMILWEQASSDGTTSWNNFDDLQSAYQDSDWFDDNGLLTIKIKGMSLTVTQELEFTAVGDEGRNAMFGPKYVAINTRAVNGTINLFMPQDIYNRVLGIRYPGYAFAMYFGGPFLFILPNVDLQEPSAKFTAAGVDVTLNFIARAAPNAQTTVPYQYFLGDLSVGNFSEFLIPTDVIEATNNE